MRLFAPPARVNWMAMPFSLDFKASSVVAIPGPYCMDAMEVFQLGAAAREAFPLGPQVSEAFALGRQEAEACQ